MFEPPPTPFHQVVRQVHRIERGRADPLGRPLDALLEPRSSRPRAHFRVRRVNIAHLLNVPAVALV